MTDIAIRWGGVMLILGAVLFAIATVMISLKPVVNQVFSPTSALLLLLSSICLLLALPAMYAGQASSAGWLGLAGHALLQTGVLLLVLVTASSLLYPTLNLAPGENFVLFFLDIAFVLGLLMTGVATLRAGVYPHWAAILLLGATAGFFFVFFVAEFLPAGAGQVGSALLAVLLALALAWIGVSMMRSEPGRAGQPDSLVNRTPAQGLAWYDDQPLAESRQGESP